MAVETGTGAYFVKLCIFYTCRQEGPRYRQVQVEVTTPQGEVMKCRSYHLQNLELDDGRPSPQYLRTVLLGARENHLPEEYVQRLMKIQHNGYDGEVFIP